MDPAPTRAYFTVTEVAQRTWSIAGPANDQMYLAAGREKAMLVDTGMGIGDLAGEVRKLTDLPLIVVNTHGHPDHAGGNSNFDEVWLHPADTPIMESMCSDDYRQNDIRAVLGVDHPDIPFLLAGMVRHKLFKIMPVEVGHGFDLGGRKFEVLGIPGHTPGCIGLLCSKEKLLFTGDSVVKTPVWLYLKHSLPLHTYWESLKQLKQRESEFETLLPGHQPYPLGREHLADLITCAGEIIQQPGIGEPTRTFAGEGLQWSHGKVSIIYDPVNVQ